MRERIDGQAMEFDADKLAELARNERWLASVMTPRPAAETVERVRGAMRVAMDEQWLESFATPAPGPEVVARVKAAARRALLATDHGARYRVFGALSAAAAIVFAIGLARFAALSPNVPAEASAIGENFVAAWESIESDASMASLTADMVWLDDEIGSWANKPAGQADDLDLEFMQDRIDELLTTPDYFYGTS